MLEVHKFRVSLGMPTQRATNSSSWVAVCMREFVYFFASSVPENADKFITEGKNTSAPYQDG